MVAAMALLLPIVNVVPVPCTDMVAAGLQVALELLAVVALVWITNVLPVLKAVEGAVVVPPAVVHQFV